MRKCAIALFGILATWCIIACKTRVTARCTFSADIPAELTEEVADALVLAQKQYPDAVRIHLTDVVYIPCGRLYTCMIDGVKRVVYALEGKELEMRYPNERITE